MTSPFLENCELLTVYSLRAPPIPPKPKRRERRGLGWGYARRIYSRCPDGMIQLYTI